MKLLTKTTLNVITAITLATGANAVLAADEYNTSHGMTLAGAPLGLHGADAVAFQQIGNRQIGTAVHTEVHDGVAYYFSSEANAKKFATSPASFIPQNGGFCTYGVSVGKKFNGDPKFASVVDDKLYVFLNEKIFNLFQEDVPGTISKAEKNWKEIKHTAATDL